MSEHYQNSTIGYALTEVLDDMIKDGRINPQMANRLLLQFDQVLADTLAANVKTKVAAKGRLDTYRFCDDVWTFLLRDGTFKFDGETVAAEKVKIIATNAKRAGEP